MALALSSGVDMSVWCLWFGWWWQWMQFSLLKTTTTTTTKTLHLYLPQVPNKKYENIAELYLPKVSHNKGIGWRSAGGSTTIILAGWVIFLQWDTLKYWDNAGTYNPLFEINTNFEYFSWSKNRWEVRLETRWTNNLLNLIDWVMCLVI